MSQPPKKREDKQLEKRRNKEEEEEEEEGEETGHAILDSSEEEDSDEPDTYEQDGFVVDEPEEEEEAARERERRRKKRKLQLQREREEMDEGDLLVISEGLGEDITLPSSASVSKSQKPKKRLKRLRSAASSADTTKSASSSSYAASSSSSALTRPSVGGRSDDGSALSRGRKERGGGGDEAEERFDGLEDDEDRLAKSLFGDDDEEEPVPEPGDKHSSDSEESEFDSSDDDLDDFLVYNDEDEEGRPITRKKKKKHRGAGVSHITESQLQEANSIFGGDMSEFLQDQMDDEYKDYGDDFEGDEMEDRAVITKKEQDKLSKWKQQFEPSLLTEKFFTSADEKIRVTDLPENLQLRFAEVELPKQATAMLHKEAEWIFNQAFLKQEERHLFGEIMSSSSSSFSPASQAILVPKIINTLEFLHKDHFEVPFIANYRKEYWQKTKHDAVGLTLENLWMIYDWDEKFVHWLSRKANLRTMYEQLVRRARRARRNKGKEKATSGLFDDVLDDDKEEEDSEGEDGKAARQELLSQINQEELAEYLALLEQSQTEMEIKDLYDHFQLHYSHLLHQVAATSSKYKRPAKRDFYSICRRAGIPAFANKHFGITAKQFGANLMDSYLVYEAKDNELDPISTARQYMDENPTHGFADEETVLKAARHVLAQEIAVDPHVRQSLRNTYYERCFISTYPTAKGKKEIDESHIYSRVKRLDRKPAIEFRGTQFLEILKAEKEGFLKVNITIPRKDHENDFLQETEKLYLKEGYSQVTQQWNEQRREVLREALTRFLYPLFRNEVCSKLTSDAEENAMQATVAALKERLMVAPYLPKGYRPGEEPRKEQRFPRDDDPRQGVRVMSVIWGGGAGGGREHAPTWCAMVDPEGELMDQLRLDWIDAGKHNADRKESDLKRLESFIKAGRPHVIVVGASPGELDCRRLYEDIDLLVRRMFEEQQQPRPVTVTYSDAQVSRIFCNSARSAKELPDCPLGVRQAISLARGLLDPLAEYASLSSIVDGGNVDGEELLCLHLHPLQEMLPKDTMLKHLHRCFTDVVNMVGVDVNRCKLHRHAAGVLRYVSGLGPRKANALLQALDRKGALVTSRDELEEIILQEHGMKDVAMDGQSVVYTNCIGFLRIREKHFFSSNVELDPLDDTRIHPDDYGFARKMAADALDVNESEDQWRYLVEELMNTPSKLEEIDLESFAEEWERRGKGKKGITLEDIKRELKEPFKDPRRPWHEPTADQIFSMLTGETSDTFREGMLITARVTFVTESAIYCRLENGLRGRIADRDVSDQYGISPLDVVEEGQTIQCRVLRIDKERFSVDLSCRGKDLQDHDRDPLHVRSMQDKYLKTTTSATAEDEEEECFIDEMPASSSLGTANAKKPEKKDEEKKKKSAKSIRTVNHPLFKNMTFREAEDYLEEKEVGDEEAIIIRPSSKGWDHLTITWKFYDDIIIHTDVLELDKPNIVSLGRKLKVGENIYEDLDEIIERHIRPITEYSREMMSFRYFRTREKEEIDELLRHDKTANPERIPYFIGRSKEYPGKFLLYYMPGRNPKHEYISVTPEGFRFRGKMMPGAEQLIRWFKKHYKDPIPGSSAAGDRDRDRDRDRDNRDHHHRSSSGRSSRDHRQRDTQKPLPPPSHLPPSHHRMPPQAIPTAAAPMMVPHPMVGGGMMMAPPPHHALYPPPPHHRGVPLPPQQQLPPEDWDSQWD
ncbi:Transcription elongation factor SPT6 [Balamuthia mandrillaris]